MPKKMLAVPIRINAGHHPGASNELTIGRPFGAKGRTVTDCIQLSNGPGGLAII